MATEVEVFPGYEFIETVPGFAYVKAPDLWDFEATARTFHEVDLILNGLPSKEIAERVARADAPVSVLDIGGGFSARAVLDIKQIFGDAVSVTTLDVVQPGVVDNLPVERILGDAISMPIGDRQFDVAISTFTLCFFFGEKLGRALAEGARVLKSDGIAFIHEGWFTQKNKKKQRDRFGARIGANLTVNSRAEVKRSDSENKVLVMRKM